MGEAMPPLPDNWATERPPRVLRGGHLWLRVGVHSNAQPSPHLFRFPASLEKAAFAVSAPNHGVTRFGSRRDRRSITA